MRYCLTLLMLFAVLPLMRVLEAAPAPEVYAVLEIGPPWEKDAREKHRETQIDCLLFPHGMLACVWGDPEVRKLPSVAALKDPRPWLSKNLRVTPLAETSRLRLTFQAGNRTEQVTILNSLLRVYLKLVRDDHLSDITKILRMDEAWLIQSAKTGGSTQKLQDDILFRRDQIASLKQIAVIRWAK